MTFKLLALALFAALTCAVALDVAGPQHDLFAQTPVIDRT